MDYEYDEEQVLACYLFKHARRRMTDVELRADRAGMVAIKADATERNGNARMANLLRRQWGADLDDPAIAAALADGLEAFRLRVVLRLLADPEALALINRCPSCRRIVRAPGARQCLWCKHSWRGADSSRSTGTN